MKSIKEAKLDGKRILVRVDFNVPISNGKVVENERILHELPTIKFLLQKGCKVVLMSHLGRPKNHEECFSLKPVAEKLSELINQPVKMMKDCIGKEVEEAVSKMKSKDIIMLENTRFHKEEKKNDRRFSKQLAKLGNVFVMDAFSTAHRAHASTLGVQEFLPSYYGFLVETELASINHILLSKAKPFILVLGGAKVSDKIKVVKNMLNKTDGILLGGGMPFPFLLRKGINIGSSLFESKSLESIRDFKENDKLILPEDFSVAETTRSKEALNVNFQEIPDGFLALDIGEKTIKKYIRIIKKAKRVVWNGPMGLFENPIFSKGTKGIGEAIATVHSSLVGGGDTITAIKNTKITEKFTYVSTAGGAMLELLSGNKLIALQNLKISY